MNFLPLFVDQLRHSLSSYPLSRRIFALPLPLERFRAKSVPYLLMIRAPQTANRRKFHLTPYMTPCYNESERRDRGDVPCQNGINYWQESADYHAIFVLMSCVRCWRATAMKCASQTAAAVIARSESAAARQLRFPCTNRSRKSTL